MRRKRRCEGKVMDASGAALPGATIHAIHTDTGNNFEAVADERGTYRMPLRVGLYKVTAELSGFAPLVRNLPACCSVRKPCWISN